MFRKPLHILSVLFLTCVMIFPASRTNAQCFGSLVVAPSYFEFDYLVRIAVHFGSAEDLPADIICSRSRIPGEGITEVPIWFYNVHEGVNYLEFGLESNDSITGFTPAGCITVSDEISIESGGIYRINLKLDACMPLCGPGLAGHLLIKPREGSEVTWINIVPNSDTGRMYAIDTNLFEHPLFPPSHGGFVGVDYLYTCQRPICEEPNLPAEEFEAVAGFGTAVRLTWIAGEGNVTVIRARTDRYPVSYGEGRLVVEMPGSFGQHQSYYDTEPQQGVILYYKVFSLTKDLGGEVLENSFVECSATDTTFTHGFISAKESSWGSIKKLMK